MQRLHPVFYILILEPYYRRTPKDSEEIRKGDLELEDNRFEIKVIIAYNNNIKLYKCKWIGYSEDKNT